MKTGVLVQYIAREGEPPMPGIVMRVWSDNTIELHVFHFEQTALHVRAAHPSQVRAIVDPDVIEEFVMDLQSLAIRLLDLEGELAEIREVVRTIKPPNAASVQAEEDMTDTAESESEPEQIDASKLPDDDGETPVEVHVESTSGKKPKGRAAWPH